MTATNNHFDVIVIGSGIGGSTSAILLGKYFNKKVLVLEKHWTFGGLTHEFEVDGKKFATGVHYVGAVNDDSIPDKLFNLVTNGQVEWLELPFRYDEIIFPDYKYAIPACAELFATELTEQFPEDRRAIKRFMRHTKRAGMYLGLYNSIRSFAPKYLHGLIPLTRTLFGFNPNITVQAYLDKHFKNEKLKRLLAAQWCDYGLKPNEAALMIHATVLHHYLNGAFYPKGGATSIAKGLEESLKENDATIKLNTEVKTILIKDSQAIGVIAEDGNGQEEIYTAEHIISNVGAVSTYKNLLSEHHFDFLEKDRHYLSANYDFFNIYISLNDSPEKLGFDGSNKWIFRSQDYEKAILPPDDPNFPGFYCLLFPSLKAKDKSNHAMEVITLLDYEVFAPWENQLWQKRDETYYQLKERIVNLIFNDIEHRYPGFKGMIHTYDASTPLTTQHFISREKGSSYGIPYSTKRMNMKWLSANTPFKNLYLSGQDAMGPGVMGAMFGGVAAAAKVAGGNGYPIIMKEVSKHQIRRREAMSYEQ